jgi:tRNA (guanine-N7-)-methyltransferase
MNESETTPDAAPFQRKLRSFVRREGRMTDGQKSALERLWPGYGLDAPPSSLSPASGGGDGMGVHDLAQVFGRKAPVVFEIGFGNGDHLLSRATLEPQHDFIGVEVHRPGVGRLLHNAEKAGLNNLRVSSHDAVEVLEDWIADAALHEAVIYFPDPWHKTRHHKRRLIQPAFAALLARKLAPGGRLLLATDWAHYAEHMLEVLNAAPAFSNLAADGRYVPRHVTRPKTRFEARGERLGHEVFDLEFRRL